MASPHLDGLRDGRFEHPDFIPKGVLHVGPRGAVEVGTQVATGENNTFKFNAGVQTPPVFQYAGNQVTQPLRRVELGAEGDQDAVRRREGVGHEGAGGPVGVDDDVVVVGPERGKDFLQETLCAHLGKQVSFQLAQGFAAGDQIHLPASLDVTAGVRQILILQQPGHDIADSQHGGLSIGEKRGGKVCLGIEVYAENPPPLFAQDVGQMLANCCFGYAAFLVGNGDDFTHFAISLLKCPSHGGA